MQVFGRVLSSCFDLDLVVAQVHTVSATRQTKLAAHLLYILCRSTNADLTSGSTNLLFIDFYNSEEKTHWVKPLTAQMWSKLVPA